MAASKITTAPYRARLAPRGEPYYHKVMKGRFIGYRKTAAGGTWIARYTEGKTKTHSRLGKDTEIPEYDDALQLARDWFNRIADDRTQSGPYTLATCIADYIRDLRTRSGDDAAKRNEQVADKHIVRALGTAEAGRLSKRRLTEWRDNLVAKSDDPDKVRKSKDSANRVLTILKAALNRAFGEGSILSDSEWRRIKPFKNVSRARDVFLTVAQCKALVTACENDFTLLVQSGLLTGARYSELTERRVADFDIQQGVLHITNGKTGPRDVVLNDTGIEHFKLLAKGKLPADYLHQRDDGTPWNRAHQSRRIRDAVKAANSTIEEASDHLPINTVFYSLRHSHASMALLAGVNIQVLAENMGTGVRMIEKHYGKFLKADRRAMFNAVQFQ